jgi:hypothetical protein
VQNSDEESVWEVKDNAAAIAPVKSCSLSTDSTELKTKKIGPVLEVISRLVVSCYFLVCMMLIVARRDNSVGLLLD